MTSYDFAFPTLLDVRGLSISFNGAQIVRELDLYVSSGEVLGIVGESGSGKSLSMLGLLGLVDEPGCVRAKRLNFDGENLLNLSLRQRRYLLGNKIGVIFQDALSALNPSYTVGFQIGEVLKCHKGLRGSELKKQVLDLLDKVGIADATNRINSYPHQLSGGMNQRVMIAMAIACNPKLLIADEPTTALDVTVQAQVMQLLRILQKEQNMALILISHDLGVVAETADRVIVMYAGQAIESNLLPDIFEFPRHPYTASLLAAMPERNHQNKRLFSLPGLVPHAGSDLPPGCLFAPRCQYADNLCLKNKPSVFYSNKNSKESELLVQSVPENSVLGKASWVRCIRPTNGFCGFRKKMQNLKRKKVRLR